MSTTIGCPIPGASQPKEPARLIDANNVMEAVFCAVELYNSEYLAIQDEIKKIPTIDPESMRPTAHWIKRGYVCGENEYECSRLPSKRMENKRKSYEVLHVLRRKDGGRTKKDGERR